MRRFFQAAGPGSDGLITLTEDEAHHAAQVIRLQPGGRAVVLDGRGGEHFCAAVAVNRREVRLRVERTQRHPPPPVRVRLVQALTKGKSFELILQKAVELGASELLPLLTERVVARPASDEFAGKQAKWRQLAVEAVKQCGAPWLPGILQPATVAEALQPDRPTQLVLVGALQTETAHPRPVIESFVAQHGKLPESISVWIGPEGDFTPEELKLVLESGARPVTLGRQVLRSETAAIYALSVLAYELSVPR